MNTLGLDVTSVGNHEFDEGYKELQRLAARRLHRRRRRREQPELLPDRHLRGRELRQSSPPTSSRRPPARRSCRPTPIKNVQRRQDRLHRHDAQGHAQHRHRLRCRRPRVQRRGQDGQRARARCSRRRASTPSSCSSTRAAPVAGQRHAATTTPARAAARSPADSPIIPIAEGLDPAIDMIVSGHTHQPYVCSLPDPSGQAAPRHVGLVVRSPLHRDRRHLRPSHADIVRPTIADSAQHASSTRDRRQGPGADGAHREVQELVTADRQQGASARSPDVHGQPDANAAGESAARRPHRRRPARRPVGRSRRWHDAGRRRS